MGYSSRVVLMSRSGSTEQLNVLVEQFLRSRVRLIAVVGVNCGPIEDKIDEMVVGDGSDESRFILTTSHPDETLQQVLDFAWSCNSFLGPDGSEARLEGAPTVVEI